MKKLKNEKKVLYYSNAKMSFFIFFGIILL